MSKVLIGEVSWALGVNPMMLRHRTRERKVYEARAAVAVALRDQLGWTLRRIGETLDRDHAAVRNAIENVNAWLQTDQEFAAKWRQVVVPATMRAMKRIMN